MTLTNQGSHRELQGATMPSITLILTRQILTLIPSWLFRKKTAQRGHQNLLPKVFLLSIRLCISQPHFPVCKMGPLQTFLSQGGLSNFSSALCKATIWCPRLSPSFLLNSLCHICDTPQCPQAQRPVRQNPSCCPKSASAPYQVVRMDVTGSAKSFAYFKALLLFSRCNYYKGSL